MKPFVCHFFVFSTLLSSTSISCENLTICSCISLVNVGLLFSERVFIASCMFALNSFKSSINCGLSKQTKWFFVAKRLDFFTPLFSSSKNLSAFCALSSVLHKNSLPMALRNTKTRRICPVVCAWYTLKLAKIYWPFLFVTYHKLYFLKTSIL